MDEGGVLGQETVPRVNRIAFEVLRRLHDSLDVEVAVKGLVRTISCATSASRTGATSGLRGRG